MSGSFTTGSQTFKFGRHIASLPSNSIFITRSVPRTIAAVRCGSVTGCCDFTTLVLGVPEDASATVSTVRIRKFQRFSGLDCWRGFKMMSRRTNRCGNGYGS
uniref:Uncharacterized protein n=1 Tax=Hyaloperonospora arabidopsidis (strain Emoy2) TaxID=559515 RepID=M4B604_HYAAE